jgi:BirA family transcriptional regulator, biotin operon repressor / biotin---[acetyl-CoA-carboxylase] ligase
MDTIRLKNKLLDKVNEIRYLPITGSTNQDAMDWLIAGAGDGCVVGADEQTAGRGRFDRKWVTLPGSALAFSMVIRPKPEELLYLPLFTPLAGIAVSSAIESLWPVHPLIKWPNDVLLGGKKICGILGELAWDESKLVGLVLGIGVNVSKGAVPPVEQVSFQAGCLEEVLKTEVDRVDFLAQILNEFHRWRAYIGSADFIEYWQDHLAFKNQEVKLVATGGAEVFGRLVGVDKTGELILETDLGETSVQVGDVHLRLRS